MAITVLPENLRWVQTWKRGEIHRVSLADWRPPTAAELHLLTIKELLRFEYLEIDTTLPRLKESPVKIRLEGVRSGTKHDLVQRILWELNFMNQSVKEGAPRSRIDRPSEAQEQIFWDLMDDQTPEAPKPFQFGMEEHTYHCYLQRLNPSSNASEWFLIDRDGKATPVANPQVKRWVYRMGNKRLVLPQYTLDWYFKEDGFRVIINPIVHNPEKDAFYGSYKVELEYREYNNIYPEKTEGYPQTQISFSSHHLDLKESEVFSKAIETMRQVAQHQDQFLDNPLAFINTYFLPQE